MLIKESNKLETNFTEVKKQLFIWKEKLQIRK